MYHFIDDRTDDFFIGTTDFMPFLVDASAVRKNVRIFFLVHSPG